MTDPLIKKWLLMEKKFNKLSEQFQAAEDEAYQKAALPENLRPATAADIVLGAIIWYPDDREAGEDGFAGWQRVDEVLYPSDAWKAYSSHNGCRYGLRGAFVETKGKRALSNPTKQRE